MGQFTWKYVATQPPQTVTLYHGDTTGHVLITLNSKVLIIDFKVRDTKSYSFFIEEEMCEVKITKEGERFFYAFEINKTVQTPLNEQRKKIEKKHLLQTGGFVLALIALVLGIAFFSLKNGAEENLVYNQETTAILDFSESEKNYTYTLDGLRYENELTSIPASVNGFPLQSGDEFIIKYSSQKPEKHTFNFQTPTTKQIETYFDRALTQHKKQAPQDSEDRAACLIEVAYKIQGFSALADFYFQNISEKENAEHNENSYKRLIRSVEFKQKSEKCLSF